MEPQSTWVSEYLLAGPTGQHPWVIVARGALFAGLLAWGVRFLFTPLSSGYWSSSFMHLVNLPFHEAGHILFHPLGRFLSVLGGSLMQWLMPALVAAAFIRQRNPFAASVGLWWLGQSAMESAPYIDDARAGRLVLLGGVTGSEVEDYHDWQVILGHLGWLRLDHALARLTMGLGAALLVLSLFWGAAVLLRQWREKAAEPR